LGERKQKHKRRKKTRNEEKKEGKEEAERRQRSHGKELNPMLHHVVELA
jgi:hypothetical protein